MAHTIITDADGNKICTVCNKRNADLKRPVLEDTTCISDNNYNPSETEGYIALI